MVNVAVFVKHMFGKMIGNGHVTTVSLAFLTAPVKHPIVESHGETPNQFRVFINNAILANRIIARTQAIRDIPNPINIRAQHGTFRSKI